MLKDTATRCSHGNTCQASLRGSDASMRRDRGNQVGRGDEDGRCVLHCAEVLNLAKLCRRNDQQCVNECNWWIKNVMVKDRKERIAQQQRMRLDRHRRIFEKDRARNYKELMGFLYLYLCTKACSSLRTIDLDHGVGEHTDVSSQIHWDCLGRNTFSFVWVSEMFEDDLALGRARTSLLEASCWSA